MTTITEGDLQITLPVGAHARKLDDSKTHGLSHCMKAVDFVVELNDRILFIELKDPDNPNAQAPALQGFLNELANGQLDAKLTTKFRDSYLYELASDRLTKPVYFIVIIGLSTLTSADLITRTDALKRQLPFNGPSGKPWARPLADGCAVMNVNAWKMTMKAFPIRRVSVV